MTTPSEWPSELFVLQGANRDDLRRNIAGLQDYLSQQPQTRLVDLAASLNRNPLSGAERLAIVADSVETLRDRLERADKKLADANCSKIRDRMGIYYATQPLGQTGQVAFLFPGEGAPYVGMLGDVLPHFPHVAQIIQQCDEMQAQSEHDNRPLSRFLFKPDDADVRKQLEEELGGLGNTMFSVLMVDWCLLELLKGMGVQPHAMAGHSAGELAALWVAGCLGSDPPLATVHQSMQELEQGEGTSAESESVLLAVGASREAMEELVQKTATELNIDPGNFFLAMDNCPHQTVVIGPPEPMKTFEAELGRKKMMFERLPFSRPYHTPLFEPFMGPLTRMFEGIPFQQPHTKLYSCTSALPFPPDPNEIRDLALSHWKSRVEFTRMVRQMHDDGVRVFVEVGPRGNLTSFVEDILRGRDFLALPADTSRRDGLTQLNHLAGQLVANHVPMRLESLYESRVAPMTSAAPQPTSQPQMPMPHGSAGNAATAYMGVMDQFLGLQNDVMQQYLHGRRSGQPVRRGRRGRGVSVPVQTPQSMPQPQPVPQTAAPTAQPEPTPAAPKAQSATPATVMPSTDHLPMIDEVVQFVPGQEITVRRLLDLDEDVFGAHHTVGGREVSYVYPERNGQPVTPMTFSLEMMAETATLMVPGQVVTAIQNVQLLKWLGFDEDEPPTIELTGKLISVSETEAELQMKIHDLGHNPQDGEQGALAAVGTVRMNNIYPEPPPVEDFPLSNERPCRIPLDVLYKNLFHGEYFQGVCSLDRFGEEGIQGQCRVLPRDGLFTSNPDPQFVLDPVFMDILMHPLAGWHLEQPDQSGRILLPFELKDMRFYGPRPAVGTEMTSQGRIVHESGRRFTHSVDAVAPTGRYWAQMHGLKYWRFYLPFGEFNFHGPKDDYFLSDNLQEAVAGANEGNSDQPNAWCVTLEPPRDLQQPGLMMASARVTLTADELTAFRKLDGPVAEKIQWLFGRMAAKDAVRLLWRSRTGARMVPADISIDLDEHGRPIATPLGQERPADYPNVSIAEAGGLIVAASSFDRPVGVDLEVIEPRDTEAVAIILNDNERKLLGQFEDHDEAVTRFLCAKEAFVNAVGRGLLDGPANVTIQSADPASGQIEVAIHSKLAGELPDLQDSTFSVPTLRKDKFIVATCILEGVPACT
ncbi:acyltransferase domain-containing protein [Thalassoroseus pseudoceratinae]|uniref:acyltransferase domain-containing protein n=1 Tax=Thalassoroseus pseudoceratinae TaxID=2713176 RepID=UPI00142266AC|nr:acyltransferase domain-containing protein [Thalassoroseus pseudoceratinae]